MYSYGVCCAQYNLFLFLNFHNFYSNERVDQMLRYIYVYICVCIHVFYLRRPYLLINLYVFPCFLIRARIERCLYICVRVRVVVVVVVVGILAIEN